MDSKSLAKKRVALFTVRYSGDTAGRNDEAATCSGLRGKTCRTERSVFGQSGQLMAMLKVKHLQHQQNSGRTSKAVGSLADPT